MNKEILNQQLSSEYSSIVGNLDRLRNAVVDQLYILFESENIKLGFPIQHRTKTISSILEKVESGRYTPKKSVQEFQDLVGLRIILLFQRDISKLSSIIEDTLTIKKKYDTSDKLKEDQFGYSSLHYVAEIPDEWIKVPMFTGLNGIYIEIQIRTLSQHSWAEASNILQYKHEGSVPKQLLRSIGRVSALLETVDLEFERLLAERDEYKQSITVDLGIADKEQAVKDEEINVDLLKLIASTMLPSENSDPSENYETLLFELKTLGVDTVDKVKKMISENFDELIKEEKRVVKLINETEDKKSLQYEYNKNRIKNEVFYTHVGLIRTALKIVHGDKWNEVFKKTTVRKQVK